MIVVMSFANILNILAGLQLFTLVQILQRHLFLRQSNTKLKRISVSSSPCFSPVITLTGSVALFAVFTLIYIYIYILLGSFN